MRNLNELIGIIRGVSFDGIVNEKEIESLRIWVGKNRNLAYNTLQVNLIRKVDEVIADNIITENERCELLDKCEQIQQELVDDNEKIYELNGIISGIISDGVINNDEVYHLKKWMDNYRQILKSHDSSYKISTAIDDILGDGIVSDLEKNELLMMLSERILETQFETKLAHIKREVRGRRIIGIDLIDILEDKNAISVIHRMAENELQRSFRSYTLFIGDPEIVFISLCLIALLEYNGKYYENVRAVYKNIYNQYPEQKVESVIRDLLNRYRTDEEKRIQKSRIINVALSNTIVPVYYLSSFFEFIFDIYRVNFDYTLPEDLEEEFQFVYDGLRNVLRAENDEVSINITKKTYRLIQTTKRLILNRRYNGDVIKLSIIVVKLIDKRLRGKPVIIYNPYLKVGYTQWEAKYKLEIEKKEHRASSPFRSRWKPDWYLMDTNIYLMPPTHKINSKYNYSDIYVEILSHGKPIYVNKEPDIREIFGGYKVTVEPVIINKPFDEISYKLMAGKQNIYDSKDALFRDFLVFDKDGREIDNNSDYEGITTLCYGLEENVGKNYYKGKYYQLASKKIKLGDSIFLAGSMFNFSSLIKPGLFGDQYEHHFIQEISSGKQHMVYRNIKYLVFESDNGPEYHDIQINSKYANLTEYNYVMNSREGVVRYIVFLPLAKAGVYDVAIYKNSGVTKKRQGRFMFGLDPNYKMDLLKLDDQTFSVDLKSDLTSNIYRQLTLHTFTGDEFNYICRGKQYRYLIPLHFDAFQVDGSEWRSFSDGLWAGSIKQDSIIRLMNPDFDTINVISDHGQMLNSINLKDDGNMKIGNIGCLLSYKETNDYVFLTLLHEGKITRGLFCNNKCILRDDTEIVIDPQKGVMHVNPWYYGEGYVYFEVSEYQGETVFRSNALKNNEQVIVDDLKINTKYIITFFEKKKGISLNKKRKMKVYEREFYSTKGLLGKEIRLIEGTINSEQDISEGEKVVFENTCIRLKKVESYGMFLADIYKVSRIQRGLRSNLIKDLTVEFSNEISSGQLILTIQKQGKKLFYDAFRKHVSLTPNKETGSIASFLGIVE